MPKRKRKTVSDSYLTKLARQASLKIWGCCLMCGNANWNQLDVHHFVHKGGHKLLRWDWKNLFPLCSSRYNTCHQEADTIKGRSFIEAKMGEKNLAYLRENERIVHKDWLREKGLSENQWRLQIKQELLEVING